MKNIFRIGIVVLGLIAVASSFTEAYAITCTFENPTRCHEFRADAVEPEVKKEADQCVEREVELVSMPNQMAKEEGEEQIIGHITVKDCGDKVVIPAEYLSL